MALWQFELDLIPAASAKIDGIDVINLNTEQRDKVRLGLSANDQTKLFSELHKILPEKESWADDLRIWGNEKTDDVQIWFDGEEIEFLSIRLSSAHQSSALIDQICTLARMFD